MINNVETTTMFLLAWLVCIPAPSRISELSLGLKRTSTWLRINSTTTDWMRTSMKAAVPLKQADSICLDLENGWGDKKGQAS